jgi:hypothetical protein
MATSQGTFGTFGQRARDILRVNGYATIAWAALALGVLVPLANRFGASRLEIAGFGLGVMLIGGDEVLRSVGRRLRRRHVLSFALANAICSAGCLVLLANVAFAGTAAVILASAAAVFGSFAIAEARVARAL